ncbi:MAG TPA: diacylglycerol kinase family protein, partial [Xanthomonadales bacterium]|nr:diacylglycerol kinase family protein [Xanthomonadales bacterium]
MLINPQAGGGRAGKLQASIELALKQKDIRLIVKSSTAPGSIRDELATTGLSGFDAVLAAGGDGTLFETVNGLMAHPPETRPALGVLPIGTGNAFCRDLGLAPGDWQSAIALILGGQTRKVDVGQVDHAGGRVYFLNIAGMGFVVAAGLTAARLKGLGQSTYTLAALWQTMRLPSQELRITVDGRLIEQDSLFVEISNSRYTGTSFLMAPGARLDDGLLDLTLVRKLSRPRLLRLFHTIYSGQHVNYPEVLTDKGREFQILQPAG